jgi:hypothetical protein
MSFESQGSTGESRPYSPNASANAAAVLQPENISDLVWATRPIVCVRR